MFQVKVTHPSSGGSITQNASNVEVQLPHGHTVEITETDQDVVVIYVDPDGHREALVSVMKEAGTDAT